MLQRVSIQCWPQLVVLGRDIPDTIFLSLLQTEIVYLHTIDFLWMVVL
jgi:hypothetical protein